MMVQALRARDPAGEQLPRPQRDVLRRADRVRRSSSGSWPKCVIPPINRAMTARQDAIRTEFAEARRGARQSAEAAEDEFKAQLADARHEAAKIREEAREQGAAIIAETREQAQAEAERIVEHGHAQIAAERQQAVASLRAEVGSLATDAGRPDRGREPRGRRAQHPRGRPVPGRPRDAGDVPRRRQRSQDGAG